MKQLKIILLASMVILFTACGGGGSSPGGDTPPSTNPQIIAIDKVKAYANDNTLPVPTVQDYTDAGVAGVTAENLDDVNTVVASLTPNDIDTTEKIQKIVDDLGINIVPIANAGPDQSVEVNRKVTIAGSGTDSDGTIVSYEWKKDTAVLATTTAFDYIPTAVGIDTLMLTVMDNDGATASDSITVTVTAAPPSDTTAPVITLNGLNPETIIQNATYVDASATAADDRDGIVAVTTTGSINTSIVGIYTIIYTATDAAGNTQTATRTVNVVSSNTDLVLHWKFEETSGTIARDSSGNNLNGALYNDPVWDSNAAVGNGALTFDGINDYVSVDSPALDFGSEDFTVAIWVKKLESSGGGSDNNWGVNKWNSGGNPGSNEWCLSLTAHGGNDLPAFNIESGTSAYQVSSSQSLIIGQWHHIVGVRSGNQILLYVDGQLEDSEYVGTASINNVGRDLSIANSAMNALQTHGTFDDLRIYSRALTGDEIQDIMNGTTLPPEDTTPPVITLNGDNLMKVTQGDTFTDPGATAMDDVDTKVTIQP